jgi:hypothetical protein
LSKFIYADLFEWLVVQINKSFEVGELMITGRSISILDIYGFESFKVYKSYLCVVRLLVLYTCVPDDHLFTFSE